VALGPTMVTITSLLHTSDDVSSFLPLVPENRGFVASIISACPTFFRCRYFGELVTWV